MPTGLVFRYDSPGRAVVVLNEAGTVIHAELVPEIAQEPDYNAALDVL